jgi:hypothetical protein
MPPSVPNGTIRRPGSSVSALGDVAKRYQTGRWNKWTERKEAHDRHATGVSPSSIKATSKAFCAL